RAADSRGRLPGEQGRMILLDTDHLSHFAGSDEEKCPGERGREPLEDEYAGDSRPPLARSQMNCVRPGMATAGSGSFMSQSYCGGFSSSFEFIAMSQVMTFPV